MRYTSILLSFLVTAISCGEGAESSPESAPVDTIKVDSIDSRSEGVDTIKKKAARAQCISRCRA